MGRSLYATPARCPENRLAETRLRGFQLIMGPWSDTRLAPASHHLSRNLPALPNRTPGALFPDPVCRPCFPDLAQYRPNAATPSPRSKASFSQPPNGPLGYRNRMLGAMAGHHHREGDGVSKLRLAALALAL